MNCRIMLLIVCMAMAAGLSAAAQDVIIDTSGTSPFLYEGRSYVPLKSAATFLGASVYWDSNKGRAVSVYLGRELVLTPNDPGALYDGRPVVLSSPPVLLGGVVYVPADALRLFENVQIVWDGERLQVRIMGPSGWGVVKVKRHPPWHGGPPPWAPAWGRRGYAPGHSGAVKLDKTTKAKAVGPPSAARKAPAPGRPNNAKAQSGKKDR